MWAVAGVVVSTMTCALRSRWLVYALLRRGCLLTCLLCVAGSGFFSIPLVRRWRPMRAWRVSGLFVPSHGERVCCRCGCLWAPGISLALVVCAFFFAVACTHTIHSSFRGCPPLRASSSSSRLGPLVVDLCPVGCGSGVGGSSFVFAGAGRAPCRVFLPSLALFRPLLGFRRPSCLFTLVQFFCQRRP